MAERISSLDEGYQTGDLSIYPEALDDQNILYTATNNAKVPLKQTLTYNGKIVVVDGDTGAFPPTGQIRIGEEGGDQFELIAYDKKTVNTFQQIKRGFSGSQQNVWRPGKAYITNSVVADHHNSGKDAIVNIERNLGIRESPNEGSLNNILQLQETRFLSPKVTFQAFPRIGTPRLTVRFQNYTTGHIIRYFWDFGDGGTSLEKSPIHTYTAEGTYTVKLNIITSTGGQGVQTKKDYVTVSKDETIPFFYTESQSNPYSIKTAAELTGAGTPTEPKTFVFVDQTDGDIVQRNWIFGDGTQSVQDDPDLHAVSHVFEEPGEYVVTLLVVLSNRRLQKIEMPTSLVVL